MKTYNVVLLLDVGAGRMCEQILPVHATSIEAAHKTAQQLIAGMAAPVVSAELHEA